MTPEEVWDSDLESTVGRKIKKKKLQERLKGSASFKNQQQALGF